MQRLRLRINSRLLPTILILGFTLIAKAQESPELFIPVEGGELKQVLIDNEYEVLEQAFFAKRYRIVRVNEMVLRKFETFRINLFDDTSYVVKREFPVGEWGLVIHWRGSVIDPSHPPSDVKLNDAVWAAIHDVRITGVAFDEDKLTGESFAARSPVNVRGCRRPSNPAQLQHAAFYSFSGHISAPLQLDDFSLRALDVSPRYHLISEIDQMKSLGTLGDSPRSAGLRQEYREYLKTLGPDPRIEWASRHRKKTGC